MFYAHKRFQHLLPNHSGEFPKISGADYGPKTVGSLIQGHQKSNPQLVETPNWHSGRQGLQAGPVFHDAWLGMMANMDPKQFHRAPLEGFQVPFGMISRLRGD